VLFEHGKVLRRCFLHEACTQLIGDANLPRGSWRDLLTSYETIIEPPVHSGSVDTQDLRGLSNGRQFAGGLFNRRLKP